MGNSTLETAMNNILAKAEAEYFMLPPWLVTVIRNEIAKVVHDVAGHPGEIPEIRTPPAKHIR